MFSLHLILEEMKALLAQNYCLFYDFNCRRINEGFCETPLKTICYRSWKEITLDS